MPTIVLYVRCTFRFHLSLMHSFLSSANLSFFMTQGEHKIESERTTTNWLCNIYNIKINVFKTIKRDKDKKETIQEKIEKNKQSCRAIKLCADKGLRKKKQKTTSKYNHLSKS